jgi:hypothetical protein
MFLILSFLRKQKGRTSPAQREGWHQWEEQSDGEGGRRVNIE